MLVIDEILTDLRSILEQYQDNPTCDTFDKIQDELTRIQRTAEELIIEYDE